MKIIIVGCGKVGTTLAEQLNRENHDITPVSYTHLWLPVVICQGMIL